MKQITNDLIKKFREYLLNEEKAVATMEKYIHDVLVFMTWLAGAEVTKMTVLEYKQELTEKYAPASVNAALYSLNSFFVFNEWYDCKVKALKIQKQIFANKDKELSKAEYERLLLAAKQKKNQRLYFLMQTICSTGIRVSDNIQSDVRHNLIYIFVLRRNDNLSRYDNANGCFCTYLMDEKSVQRKQGRG